jgi:hypothetical protein
MLYGGGAHLLEEAHLFPSFAHQERKAWSLEMRSVAVGEES